MPRDLYVDFVAGHAPKVASNRRIHDDRSPDADVGGGYEHRYVHHHQRADVPAAAFSRAATARTPKGFEWVCPPVRNIEQRRLE